jgi:hypothetical protein
MAVDRACTAVTSQVFSVKALPWAVRTDGQGAARGFHGCEEPPFSVTVDGRTNR